MIDYNKLASDYSKIILEINELERRKSNLRDQILEEFKKGNKFVGTDIKVIQANKFDMIETQKAWIAKGLKLPMKKVPEHEEIDDSIIKVESKKNDTAQYKIEYRINLSGDGI